MTRWKEVERRIAKMLGGERVPITGRTRGSSPDVKHDYFSIEVKDRQSLPDWLFDAMNQAEMSNKSGLVPLVILHRKGIDHRDDFAILKLCDIIQMYRKIKDLEESLKAYAGKDAQ